MKYIFTFGSDHLKEVSAIVNPMNIMLVVTAESEGQAREKVFNSFIGKKFATSYPYSEAQGMKDKYNMFECEFSKLVSYVEADDLKKQAEKHASSTYYDLMENK